MARYQAAVFRGGIPSAWDTLEVSAPNAQAAYAEVRARHPQHDVYYVVVARKGPLAIMRRERLHVRVRPGRGDGRGEAGVREPRRPRPAPPSLRVSLDEV
jgi:hypothetical protein